MRIEEDGELTVAVTAPASEVLAVVEDPREVQGFVAPLLDASSTRTRWVVEPVRVGPITVRPVTAVTVTRYDQLVSVRGVPVDGATPTWLEVDMTGVPQDDDTSELHVTWSVCVRLHGPQFVARLAKPLLDAEARRVTRDLSTRLVARFRDDAPPSTPPDVPEPSA